MNQNLHMDELRAQLGAAVAHLQTALPDRQLFSGPAADALSIEIEHLAMQVGSLVFDCLHFLEPLSLGVDGN